MKMQPCGTSIKVLVVTDYILLGIGIENILKKAQDIKIIDMVSSTVKAKEAISNKRPDVVILDDGLVESEGFSITEYIKTHCASVKTLLLGNHYNEDRVLQMLSTGIYGYVSKNSTPVDIIKAIRVVNSGEVWAERRLLSRLITCHFDDEASLKKLSKREQELALLIAQGCSNKEIAAKLSICEKTVKTHVTNIFKSMGVDSRLKVALRLLQACPDLSPTTMVPFKIMPKVN